MNERYIVMSVEKFGGNWGAGATLAEAKKNLRKAGGKIKGCKAWRFTSALPFTNSKNLVAGPGEADCWVGRDGSMSWVRCERTELEPAAVK